MADPQQSVDSLLLQRKKLQRKLRSLEKAGTGAFMLTAATTVELRRIEDLLDQEGAPK